MTLKIDRTMSFVKSGKVIAGTLNKLQILALIDCWEGNGKHDRESVWATPTLSTKLDIDDDDADENQMQND